MRSIQALSMSADQRRCNWATGRHPDAQFFTSVSVDDVLCFCSRGFKRVPGLYVCPRFLDREQGHSQDNKIGQAHREGWEG